MILSSAVDYTSAGLELRERFAFSSSKALEAMRLLRSSCPDLDGCILLSTCNRTELYVSASGCPDSAGLLCELAGIARGEVGNSVITRGKEDSIRHLMEVTAGLCSQVLGEDQILGQVKAAISLAREAQAMDASLESLSRLAVTAAKKIKTSVRLTPVAGSAAFQAIELAAARLGGLEHRKALVIGNGEMGRLSAELLQQRGCDVTVTVRSYKRGEVKLPEGCAAVSYLDRYAAMENCDILVSATTSPHYTVTAREFSRCGRKPSILLDLAVPRDMEPEIQDRFHISILNVDDLGSKAGPDSETLAKARLIIDDAIDRYGRWEYYRRRMSEPMSRCV